MKIYAELEILSDIIDDGETFLCSYEDNSDRLCSVNLFCVLKSANQKYHKVKICCNDMQGTYKCGQWYTSISLKSLDVSRTSSEFEKDELQKLINVVAILLFQNKYE